MVRVSASNMQMLTGGESFQHRTDDERGLRLSLARSHRAPGRKQTPQVLTMYPDILSTMFPIAQATKLENDQSRLVEIYK